MRLASFNVTPAHSSNLPEIAFDLDRRAGMAGTASNKSGSGIDELHCATDVPGVEFEDKMLNFFSLLAVGSGGHFGKFSVGDCWATRGR